MFEFLKGTVTPKDWTTSGAMVGAAVLLSLAFYFLVHQPQVAKLDELTAQNEQLREDLAFFREQAANIDALRAEATKMKELVTQFQERLPESREIPTLLKPFEEFAGEIGLLVELSQLPIINDAHKQVIPYTVKARGDFHQIVMFINRLERFQRYLKVSNLDISQQKTGEILASFTLSTFRFVQPTESGKTKAADSKGAKKK